MTKIHPLSPCPQLNSSPVVKAVAAVSPCRVPVYWPLDDDEEMRRMGYAAGRDLSSRVGGLCHD